ncbi:MAG TPA: cytochrome c-type biogenesis protein CcmH, partial [Rhodospirillales bacterium]|nr:cytochrome c-type biogenesis protein CcmH [Rhodospirillales bacterium]
MKFTSLALFYIVVALLTTSFPSATYAVDPSEILDNPILEKRARHISKDLRCLVCQNQSIDDSDANLARDLR